MHSFIWFWYAIYSIFFYKRLLLIEVVKNKMNELKIKLKFMKSFKAHDSIHWAILRWWVSPGPCVRVMWIGVWWVGYFRVIGWEEAWDSINIAITNKVLNCLRSSPGFVHPPILLPQPHNQHSKRTFPTVSPSFLNSHCTWSPYSPPSFAPEPQTT